MTTTKLFVGNIARGSDQAELRKEFERFGAVAECDIISDYGFVHFVDSTEADAALAGMHGAPFNGQNLKVEKSTSYVRKKPGDGNLSAETCYVCGRTGHWAKNCPQVPEEEREKQSRRAERNKRGGFGGYPGFDEERMPFPGDPRDFYDEYEVYPPRRRRPPPPPYYDDYDDYYPRRRLPPPLYYDDPYDYDYPLPPPRRRPPPGYYRYDDRYPLPPRRPLPPREYDDYRYERVPIERVPYERAPLPVAAPAPAAPVYYDFADDNVERLKVQRPPEDIDPWAGSAEREPQPVAEPFSANGGDSGPTNSERFQSGETERYVTAEESADRFRDTDRQLPAAYASPGPERTQGEYYRRAPRPY